MIICQFENSDKKVPLRHVTVGALVLNEKKEILLIKRAPHLLNGNKFGIPGGFLDRDETTQEAVLRELREETGYEGNIVSLFHIIDAPHRPKEDRQNVEFRYIIEVTGGSPTISHETSQVTWFTKENLPKDEEFAFDHRESIVKLYEYQKNKVVLPLIN